jgi:hypothetical protein
MGRYDHITDWFKKRHDTLIAGGLKKSHGI